MEHLDKITVYLQLNKLDSVNFLKPIQQKTTLKPSVLVLLSSIFLILVTLLIDISPLIIGIVCVLIPGYYTFQTIGTKKQIQYIKYTVYWIMFGMTQIIVEPVVGFIFGSFFLMILQIALTVILIHPKFNMALILYDRVIRKLILKDKPQIFKSKTTQNIIKEVSKTAQTIVNEVSKVASISQQKTQ